MACDRAGTNILCEVPQDSLALAGKHGGEHRVRVGRGGGGEESRRR